MPLSYKAIPRGPESSELCVPFLKRARFPYVAEEVERSFQHITNELEELAMKYNVSATLLIRVEGENLSEKYTELPADFPEQEKMPSESIKKALGEVDYEEDKMERQESGIEKVASEPSINLETQGAKESRYALSEETWGKIDSLVRGAILGGLAGSVFAGEYSVAGAAVGTLLGAWAFYKAERED